MEPIAIIGWCGQFPGAPDVEALWALIRDGRCALRSPGGGAPPRGLLDEPWAFSADSFGLTAREAALLDPQQRLFLEAARGALERAGYGDPTTRPRAGLFGSLSASPLRDQLLRHNAPLEPFELDGTLGDLAAGRAAWLLGLEGPCLMVQSACSSSLVALHLAVQSLWSGEVDLAVVAAASVAVLAPGEDQWVEGGTRARDGRCRPFDADATGTLGGDAAVAVVLQRTSDAARARPLALILGTAALNDGAARASFTAPSAAGQAATLREALHVAQVAPAALGYLEAHGSGTPLGDAVEIEGLCAALGPLPSPLPLGALKANLGHTDAAAGLCGLLKAALCLHHGWRPPTPGFQTPHPALLRAPLRVLSRGEPWPDGPRLAAVSAFGMGGTNACAILQAASPPPPPPSPTPPATLLTWSADDAPALAEWGCLLREHLDAASPEETIDIAYTSNVGRAALRWRAAAVGRGRAGLLEALRERQGRPVEARAAGATFFLCEGAARFGAAELGELLSQGGAFRARWEACAAACAAWLSLGDALGPEGAAQGVDSPLWHAAQASAQLALAAQWGELGLAPAGFVGHSLGQWVAAILAGVFGLEEGLGLIIRRAALLEALPAAALLAIPVSAGDVAGLGIEGAALAIAHGQGQCVIACDAARLAAVEAALQARGLVWRALEGARPVHTDAAREAAAALRGLVAAASPQPPRAPLLCNTTGRWMTPEEARAPETWARHLEAPARLDLGWGALWAASPWALVSLGTQPAVAQQAALEARRAGRAEVIALPSLSRAPGGAWERWLRQVGALWSRGAPLRLEGLWRDPRPARAPLPPTPRARRRFDPAALWATAEAPPPPTRRVETTTPRSAQTTPHLEALIEVWERSFGLAPIGPDDDFYALGGHSLLALQLLSRLRRSRGVELPMRLLLEHPSPRAMALAWARWEREDSPSAPPERWRAAPDVAAALRPWLARLLERLPLGGEGGVAPLLAALEGALGLPLYPHELARCADADALARLLAEAARPAAVAVDQRSKAPSDQRSKPSDRRSEGAPAAAFVLSSARSGSTLLRVMLAGHPEIFAPPELHLWMYRDLEERAARLPSAHFGQGLPRALQELRGGTFAQAQAEADQWRREGLTIAQADARLRALCAPRRLVDKSPSYAESPETLAALSAVHPEAALIHLVRHPLAVMESYVRRRMGAMSRGDARDPWAQAEAHWATCQRNLLWLERRHPGRWLRVYYEDLVTDPERWLRRVCGHLGVGFDAATLTPYQGRRMIDGIGDPGLHERDALDPALASAWRGVRPPRALQPDAAALALTLGYDWEEP